MKYHTAKLNKRTWIILCLLLCCIETAVIIVSRTWIDGIFGTTVCVCILFLAGMVCHYGLKNILQAFRDNRKAANACLLSTILYICLAAYCFKDHGISSVIGQYALLSQVFLLPIVIFGLLGIFVWKLDMWKLFLIIGTGAGLSFMLSLPIGSVPDEVNHINSAYRLSNIYMGIENVDGGIAMRAGDEQHMAQDYGVNSYLSTDAFEAYLEQLNAPLQDGTLNIKGAVTISQLYCYILPAAGITLGRILGMGTYAALMLGRIFNFIFYMCIAAYALKKIPYGKLSMWILLLMPMAIQQGMSYSYDVLVNGLAMVVIAFTIKIAVSKESPYLTKREWIVLAVSTAAFIPLKFYAYFLIGLMPWTLFLLKKFPLSKKTIHRLEWTMGILVLLIIAAVAVWGLTGAKNYQYSLSLYHDSEQHAYSIAYFIGNPFELIPIMVRTLENSFGFYCETFVGEMLGWLDLKLPHILTAIYYILLFVSSIQKMGAETVLSANYKKAFFLVSLFTALFVFAGLLLSWSTVEIGLIQGVQGRYFIPIAPLLLYLFTTPKLQIDQHVDSYLMVTVLICVLFVSEFLIIRL